MYFKVPLWTDDAINHHFFNIYFHYIQHWLQLFLLITTFGMNSSLFVQYTSGYKYQDIPLTFLSE